MRPARETVTRSQEGHELRLSEKQWTNTLPGFPHDTGIPLLTAAWASSTETTEELRHVSTSAGARHPPQKRHRPGLLSRYVIGGNGG